MGFISTDLIIDILDILVVSYLLYRLFILMKGTRAVHMFIGLIILFVLSVAAQWINLIALNWIISSLKTVWVIAFVIIFQPELRRALASIGQHSFLRRYFRVEETGIIPEIIKACTHLTEKGLGALIVLEKDMGLKNYVETGTKIDAKVGAELLETIFTPPSPLHDGAVIIQNDRVVAAGCILPLTQDQRLSATLGTRHRAALGLSEETDAIIIVVSEETRTIAYAQGGKLKRKIDTKTLRNDLLKNFGLGTEETVPSPASAT
ncbi:MAG: TIGR00159 family protein [Candidatus Latescibacteria bacterium]|nr:TIGR00159 family protein [Candidatus Latescibacterota bacterium]NIM66409.1 TIGR00159 family protein [Candidatus Latescibacterota bacterium]NIO02888.1 TIGR00159 family protein [Candidatus Latescibacterota bacterium]NIO30023.1 TIGR00159 family protein [Candidatus Latescibacterota bacterium]NIO57638.1 TIGR00159 family protein [Candidatus Latescibacterota bacterium]